MPHSEALNNSEIESSGDINSQLISIINSLKKDVKILKDLEENLENSSLPEINPGEIQIFSTGNIPEDLYPKENYVISVSLDSGRKISGIYWEKDQSLLIKIREVFGNSKINLDQIHEINILDFFIYTEKENPVLCCHPRYKQNDPLDYHGESISLHLSKNDKNNYSEQIESGERGLAITLQFNNSVDFERTRDSESGYLCFSIPGDSDVERVLIWIKRSESDNIPPIGSDVVNIDRISEIKLYEYSDESISLKNWVINKIITHPDLLKFFSIHTNKDNEKYTLWSGKGSFSNGFFTNISGIEGIINQSLTQDFLRQDSEELKRLEFYSKTIGPSDEDIKVKIESINYYQDRYRITISRFNYKETFDVNLYDTPDREGRIESLDNIINKNSRLVECKLFREKPDGTEWKEGDPLGKLPLGEWYLKRAYTSEYTTEMYWESLRKLQETEVKEDFLCIPEIEYYLKHEENYENLGYFPEYKEILNYCEARNCQALIGNLNFGYSENLPEKEEDLTERVIYKVDENSYKVFWKGVLRDLNINSSCKMLFWINSI